MHIRLKLAKNDKDPYVFVILFMCVCTGMS